MRIGLDGRLLHYNQAGIGQYTLRLLEGLGEIDSSNQFVVLQSRKDQAPLASGPTFQRRTFWTPPHHRREQLLLPLELARLRLDVLHSPDFIPPLHRRCKSVITVHDLAFLRYPHLLTPESRRYYGQIKQAVISADHIIAVSESTKRDLVSQLGVPEAKVTVIYEAVDPIFRRLGPDEMTSSVGDSPDAPPLIPPQAGGDQGTSPARGDHPSRKDLPRMRGGLGWGDFQDIELFYLFVGTIEPRKNLPLSLQALDKIRIVCAEEGQVPPKLVVAGKKGWLCDDVYKMVGDLRLEKEVLFLGGVSAQQLVQLYNRTLALVFPSLYEGFGLPALEAMACGAPVLASNVSSLPEVVGEAGVLLDPHEASDWVEAMLAVWRDLNLRQQLSERGLARARQFSRRKMASETLEVYRKVVKGA